jgi:pimeloyl-ACP methyl ester carboxylesterase
VIILSNSLLAPLQVWDHFVKVLNNNGYHTLRYDQPGHGGSSAPKDLNSTTFDSIAEDVHHLLNTLGINKVYSWVGVSMGASAGIYYATKYPNVIRKLAICDTISSSPVNAGTEDAFGPRVAAAREAGNLESTIESTLERWFGQKWMDKNPEETRRMRTLMSGTTIDGFETCCNALRSDTYDLRPRFSKIGASVDDAICIVGENDANLPQTMADMRGEIQKGFQAVQKDTKVDLVVIKNAGHVSFVDGFEQFVRELDSWLARQNTPSDLYNFEKLKSQ